MTISDSEV